MMIRCTTWGGVPGVLMDAMPRNGEARNLAFFLNIVRGDVFS